jgi:hypothetical protein
MSVESPEVFGDPCGVGEVAWFHIWQGRTKPRRGGLGSTGSWG